MRGTSAWPGVSLRQGGITRHEVGHVLGILTLPLAAQTHRGAGKQQGRDEGPAHPDPGDEIGPVVHNVGALNQQLQHHTTKR